MFALISPNEKRGNFFRVADLSKEPFDVASPLFWVEAPQEVSPSTHLFDNSSATFVLHAQIQADIDAATTVDKLKTVMANGAI